MSSLLCRLALLSIGLFIGLSSLYAQYDVRGDGFKPIQLDVNGELSMPLNTDVRVPFYFGGSVGLGLRMALTSDQRIWLIPHFSAKGFMKKAGEDGDHTINEDLDIFRIGLQLDYAIWRTSSFSILPFARVDHNWVSNYFSEEYDYDFWTGTSTTVRSKDYLKGDGLSYTFGCKLQFGEWYAKASYDYMKTSMRVNKDVVNEALQAGFVMPDYYRFDFSTVNVGVGYNLTLNRRKRKNP